MTLSDTLVSDQQTFGRPAAEPCGVSEERRAEVLQAAVQEGRPVPEEFDWWADMPPGAVA